MNIMGIMVDFILLLIPKYKIEIMIKKLYFLTKSFLNLMFSVLAIRSITSIFTNDAHYINNLK